MTAPPIRLHDTLSGRKKPYEPAKDAADTKTVTIYNCGPTVYDSPHIGNYRTFVMDDLLRRVFEYNGYKVDQAMNITDVDDKTIRRSREEGVPLVEITQKYETLFLEELDSLRILRPGRLLRATENIPAMTELVGTLIRKEKAYVAGDGVYLNISSLNNYGALAGLKTAVLARAESQLSGNIISTYSRVRNDEYDKGNTRDFALWKFETPEDGGNSWPASFGAGRPGWHIECSAMAMRTFGPTIDVHTGGSDLIFPHHTNEIAQSESATDGKQFVRYWVHGAFMNVSNEKMAKSKGNFLKLADLAAERVSPLAYRYWLLTAHYRTPVDFTYEAVRAAQNSLIRLMSAVGGYPDGGRLIPAYEERFLAAVNDDLDLPKGVALAWELVKDTRQSEADKKATLLDFDRVFGLGLATAPKAAEVSIPEEVKALADARQEARRAKDWKKADALRLEIEARGFEVKDTSAGAVILPK